MKQIDIDDELYQYIASNTQSIGESASTILRRLLNLNGEKINTTKLDTDHKNETVSGMNPKNITDSEYWVMTNSNTTRKKMMLHEVALSLGYSNEQAEKIRDYL